jgi:hypothetical protein
VDIQKGKVQPLWVGIDIASTAKPGAYEGEIEIQAEGMLYGMTSRLGWLGCDPSACKI